MVAGQVLAKIPRATTRTRDITGGLARVVELFLIEEQVDRFRFMEEERARPRQRRTFGDGPAAVAGGSVA